MNVTLLIGMPAMRITGVSHSTASPISRPSRRANGTACGAAVEEWDSTRVRRCDALRFIHDRRREKAGLPTIPQFPQHIIVEPHRRRQMSVVHEFTADIRRLMAVPPPLLSAK